MTLGRYSLARFLPGQPIGKIHGQAKKVGEPVGRCRCTTRRRRCTRATCARRSRTTSRRNSYISGGTGPHYYQEIEASPVNPELVYQMDVFIQVTRNGGATFEILETGHDKHSDNHALVIDPANGRHLIVGTDSGVYESFDEGKTWRHFPNLPVSQFYKVALNNRVPFYDILGGAQDLGTLHGPSRTMNRDGIRNQDWYVPLGADGYGVAFDPRDPDILYMMWQEGNLIRKDRRSDEGLGIRPQPAPGDPAERWNWDSPLLVSPHNPDRIYYGSQRLWRSDDRGSAWTAISGDLTLGRNRYEQKFLGRTWSVDSLFDHGAMSKYATTTAISESPLQAGVLVVGTDDGLVQVSDNGGQGWTRASALPGLPAASFINDVEASLHDARTIYVVADNHKNGDFSPYVYESADLGRTWRSISGDLPKGTIVWAIQQDHVRADLLFLGTEFGIYVSTNRGVNWFKLSGGVPTISFRDIKLHRRDNDLVAASFGRGFYVLDDYSPLREIAAGALAAEGALFPVRDAWWFVPYQPGQAPGRPEKGTDDFTTPNPPMGALLTYYLKEAPTTAKEARQASEKTLAREGGGHAVPGIRPAPRGGARKRTEGPAGDFRRRGSKGPLDRGTGQGRPASRELGPARSEPGPCRPESAGIQASLGRVSHRPSDRPGPLLGGADGGLREWCSSRGNSAIVRSEAGTHGSERHGLRGGGRLPATDRRTAATGRCRGGEDWRRARATPAHAGGPAANAPRQPGPVRPDGLGDQGPRGAFTAAFGRPRTPGAERVRRAIHQRPRG